MAETLESKVASRVRDRDKLGKQIADKVAEVAKLIKQLDDLDLETYGLLNKPDALYGDCPIGRAFTHQWIKEWMIKNDMDFVGYFLDGKVNIKNFVDRIKDSSMWAMRFTKEPVVEKTGLEAIL